MAWYRWDGDDLLLFLYVQPRASRDEWAGPMDEAFKVRITAAPVDGRANTHLVRFPATAFGITRAHVHLSKGASSRRKTFRIDSPKRLPLPALGN